MEKNIVAPGLQVRLRDWDPEDTSGVQGGKVGASVQMAAQTQKVDALIAYKEALSRTSTAWAPWRIIASNHNWCRNPMVAQAIVGALEGLGLRYPEPPASWEKVRID